MKSLIDILEGFFDADDVLDDFSNKALMDEMNAREDASVREIVDTFLKDGKFGDSVPMKQRCVTAFNKFLKDIRWRMIYKSNEWWKEPPYENNQIGVYLEGKNKLQEFIIFMLDPKRSDHVVNIAMGLDWSREEMYIGINSMNINKMMKIWNSSDVKHKYVMKQLKK